MIPVQASLKSVSAARSMSADVVPCRDCLSGHKDKFVSRPLMSQMGAQPDSCIAAFPGEEEGGPSRRCDGTGQGLAPAQNIPFGLARGMFGAINGAEFFGSP